MHMKERYKYILFLVLIYKMSLFLLFSIKAFASYETLKQATLNHFATAVGYSKEYFRGSVRKGSHGYYRTKSALHKVICQAWADIEAGRRKDSTSIPYFEEEGKKRKESSKQKIKC